MFHISSKVEILSFLLVGSWQVSWLFFRFFFFCHFIKGWLQNLFLFCRFFLSCDLSALLVWMALGHMQKQLRFSKHKVVKVIRGPIFCVRVNATTNED